MRRRQRREATNDDDREERIRAEKNTRLTSDAIATRRRARESCRRFLSSVCWVERGQGKRERRGWRRQPKKEKGAKSRVAGVVFFFFAFPFLPFSLPSLSLFSSPTPFVSSFPSISSLPAPSLSLSRCFFCRNQLFSVSSLCTFLFLSSFAPPLVFFHGWYASRTTGPERRKECPGPPTRSLGTH